MVYKIIEISEPDDETLAKYCPFLSPTRLNTIASMPTVKERQIALCSEIVSRQCLSELLEAPEFSFKLLLNPNGKSAVSNFSAEISLALCGDYLGCAVSKNKVGISLQKSENIKFSELQTKLSDKEIRDVFSFSKNSYTELVKKNLLDEKDVCLRAATYLALKQSYFRAKGKMLNNNMLSVEFDFDGGNINCSDKTVEICELKCNRNNNYVYSVAEVKNE